MKLYISMSNETIEATKQTLIKIGSDLDVSREMDRYLVECEKYAADCDKKKLNKFANQTIGNTRVINEDGIPGEITGKFIDLDIDEEFVVDSLKVVAEVIKVLKPAFAMFYGVKKMLKGISKDLTEVGKDFGKKWATEYTYQVHEWYNTNKEIDVYTISKVNSDTKKSSVVYKTTYGPEYAIKIVEENIEKKYAATIRLEMELVGSAATVEGAMELIDSKRK